MWIRVALLLLVLSCLAQPRTRKDFASPVGFENGKPAGWGFPENAAIDTEIKHSGTASARIIRTPESPNGFTTVTTAIPIDFEASVIEWRGFIKTEDVRDHVALWCRVDGDQRSLAFASLQSQKINGTRDWQEYSISVKVPKDGEQVVFGFLLGGPGRMWVDDLQLLADGKPVSEAPQRVVPKTVLDDDTTFNKGSGISLESLNAVQTGNLAALGKIWGFLKYHHPAITAGTRHWDFELLRVLPAVVAAETPAAANASVLAWIEKLGPIAPCAPCAKLPERNVYRKPDIAWIDDAKLLGPALSAKLREVYANRPAGRKQFYLATAPNVGNPQFEHELTYPAATLPDAGMQLLGLFRLWNIVHYFYPARDTMADTPANTVAYWDAVLTDAVPRVALTKTKESYQLELLRVIAKINDTHANLWSSLDVRPPVGACRLPVHIRFVEGVPLVIRQIGAAAGLEPGDRVAAIGGVPVATLIEEWRPFYAASNEPTRLRDMAAAMTRGACGPVKMAITRAGKPMTVDVERVKTDPAEVMKTAYHDRPGPAFQKLSTEVAYLKLSNVKVAEAAQYIRDAAGTKGLIIDIRNYPSEFMVFALGALLHKEKTAFVRFTYVDPANPGLSLAGIPLEITPAEPHYAGKVVVLVNEQSISQSEYTAMAFRSVPGAVVIGSTTAGADGNVSQVPLPGGYRTMISGLGVFYPDMRPTQRVGIVPDIVVSPTIEGVKAGKDELVDAAVRHILK